VSVRAIRRGVRACASRAPARLARARRAGAGDRGASAIELAILAPLLLLATLLIVEYAMWFDARHAALAAAQEGDMVARQEEAVEAGSWQADAESAAVRFYDGLDTSVLTSVTAANPPPQVTGATVSVTVSGTLNWLFSLHISETVTGPVECFRAEASGGAQCAADVG
jgi:Flp pilus assembly protein TadG